MSDPDAVPRRRAIELTEGMRRDLEDQGITRKEQYDDFTIGKTRHLLAKHTSSFAEERSEIGGELLTKTSVMRKIATLMEKSEGGGMSEYTKNHAMF